MKLVMCHNCGGIEINNFTPYVDGGIYCDCEENKERIVNMWIVMNN